VHLDVTDTGTGIPEKIRERIFDSFLSGRPDGTGLGLAVCHSIVAAQGGRISAANRERGSVFSVAFPKAEKL
jgi:signal transduction histidine kinase